MAYITDGTAQVTPRLVLGYASSQDSRTVVHDILDRADPDISLAASSTRSGTLSLLFHDEDDAEAARAMHAEGARLRLVTGSRSHADMAYVVSGRIALTLDDDTRDTWTLAVEFREVAP